LIANRADTNVVNMEGVPLQTAVGHDHAIAVKVLLIIEQNN